LADHKAKAAARGIQTDKQLLPTFLRHMMLTNPNAVKQRLVVKLNTKQKKTWRALSRGMQMMKIDTSTLSNKLIDAISHPNISRHMASLIVQLRISHIPVNFYLHRFKKIESTHCPACGCDTEDIPHLLLECPGYAYERWALAHNARKLKKEFCLKTLLGEPNMVIALATFLVNTHQFDTQKAK